MNTKRLLVFGMLGIFIISMMAGVLADNHIDGEQVGEDVAGFFSELGSGIGSFFESMGVNMDTVFLSQLFFALLLGMIIYTVVSTFFSDSGKLIQWGITGAITFIAFFGIPDGYLEVLQTTYGAMGLTMLTVIPFAIMVLFTVKVEDLMIARGTWAFYVIYYMFTLVQAWLDTEASGWPYFLAMLGGVFMFVTIPWVRSWFAGSKLDAYVEKGDQAIDKNAAIQKLRQKSDKSVVDSLS